MKLNETEQFIHRLWSQRKLNTYDITQELNSSPARNHQYTEDEVWRMLHDINERLRRGDKIA